MTILNIFKRGKKEKMRKLKETPEAITSKKIEKTVSDKEIQKVTEKTTVSKEKNAELDKVYRIIKHPHITEKATVLSEKNQYVFKVRGNANKNEVMKAVEDYYGVKVVDAKIINIPEKKRRRGKGTGIVQGYKKAIVHVAPGQKIEVLPR